MMRPDKWLGMVVAVILLMIAARGLLDAIRPIIGWLVGLTASGAVIALVVLVIYRRSNRW